ncbi:MAG: RHS repeat-associated core domain-containing protein, partial [Actinomycetia bacterium]|nr:RHS repeat-associated core domain-containing protein [Actinomycetes bacterium]
MPTGVHSLHVVPGSPIDLAGLGVAELFELEFTVQDPAPLAAGSQKALNPLSSLLFKLPEGNFVPVTERGNRHTFHGRPVDPETGFIYFRNRYLDPEFGRFITTDPMGYADAPSLYQFALNNPVDFSDPTGEAVGFLFDAGFAIYDTWAWGTGQITGGQYALRMSLTGASVIANAATGGTGG